MLKIFVQHSGSISEAASLLKVKTRGGGIRKCALTRENILVDLHGGCLLGSLSLVARTTVTL